MLGLMERKNAMNSFIVLFGEIVDTGTEFLYIIPSFTTSPVDAPAANLQVGII